MNVIELVNKYLPILDEQYKLEARSAVLDVAPEFVQMTRDAKKVKIAKMTTDGLGDYSRHSGFVAGYAELTWEEHEFTQDRGRAIQIDDLDDEETFGMAFGRLAGEFQRVHVIPEIDAYRFAKYYQSAGTKVAIEVTAGAIMKYIDEADAQMDDDEVPEDGRILFVNPQVYKLMINDPEVQKHITVEDRNDKEINKKFYWYDNHMIIKVPSGRFYTKITQLDGSSQGEEAGGFEKAPDGEVIGLLMVSTTAIIQLAKRRIARVWAPTKEQSAGTDGVNPNADAWKFDYRIYHDAWVLEKKIAGIYAATISGNGITMLEAIDGNYDFDGGVFTPGNTTYHTSLEGTTLKVSGVIPYGAAVPSINLGAGNHYTVKLVNSGIASKAALPSGYICRRLRANGTYEQYTKDVFEDDGSLIICCNADELRIGITEITWTAGVTTTYVMDTLGAELAPEA